jgi:hypothetical protein
MGRAGGAALLGKEAAAAQTAAATASSTSGKSSGAAADKSDENKPEKSDEAKGNSFLLSLDDLVEEYNTKRATKAMEGLSFDQIQAGLRHLEGKSKGYEVSAVKAELYRAWARMDSQAAWKTALAMADDEGRSACLGAIAGELAKTNPDAAIKLAMTLGMGSARAEVLRALFRDWGKVNMSAAIAYWNSHPDLPTDAYAISHSFYELAKHNPEQAAVQALTLTIGPARQNSLESVLSQWARKDYDAALSWAQNIQDPTARDDALAALFQGGDVMNPQRGMDALKLIESPEKRREVQRTLISSWMRKTPAAALDYLLREGGDKLDQNLSWSLGYAMQTLTNEERTTLIARLPEGQAKDQILSNLASNYIYNGRYSQAVAALNTLPDSSERDGSLHHLGQQWGKKEPQAAANWINAQQDSSDRDLVVAGYATSVASRDPQAALQWASSIPDKSIQTTAYKNVVSRWFGADAKSAQAWLNSTNVFTPAEKKSIQNNAPGLSTSTYVPQVSNRR